jgi:hypothetical protein
VKTPPPVAQNTVTHREAPGIEVHTDTHADANTHTDINAPTETGAFYGCRDGSHAPDLDTKGVKVTGRSSASVSTASQDAQAGNMHRLSERHRHRHKHMHIIIYTCTSTYICTYTCT